MAGGDANQQENERAVGELGALQGEKREKVKVITIPEEEEDEGKEIKYRRNEHSIGCEGIESAPSAVTHPQGKDKRRMG